MKTEGLIHYFVMHCLDHYFASKTEMAQVLDISYRTILGVTNKPDKCKGASLVFQGLMIFCMANGISVDAIMIQFIKEYEIFSEASDSHVRETQIATCAGHNRGSRGPLQLRQNADWSVVC